MPNSPTKMTVSFDAMLDTETDKMLSSLSESGNVSKATIVRAGIRAHFNMARRREPRCADGRGCLCPHVHIFPGAGATPPANPDDYQEGR